MKHDPKTTTILAIETSCDETAASVLTASPEHCDVRTNIISSQAQLHAQWGGVVPNLAAREHTKNIIPVLTQTLNDAHISHHDIDLLAVTHGPGLIPALLCGVSAAKSLSYAWHKPLLGIHHIEGHIYANWIEHASNIHFPVLALIVSGGHTQLTLMTDHCTYETIGETQDDAVGEAFDKVARILGLGYPGGPIISQRARTFSTLNTPCTITLPRPMKDHRDYNFSFSGLKTAALYAVKDFRKTHHLSDHDPLPDTFVSMLAYAFQEAVTDVLIFKTIKAAQEYAVRSVILAGGVSANTQLRELLHTEISRTLPGTFFAVPSLPYCLDNAAMIAMAAYYRHTTQDHGTSADLMNSWHTVSAKAHRNLQN